MSFDLSILLINIDIINSANWYSSSALILKIVNLPTEKMSQRNKFHQTSDFAVLSISYEKADA